MDVLCGIAVSVMVFSTSRTCPLADPQVLDLFVLEATVVAKLGARIELVYFDDSSANLLADVFQKALELCKSVLHDFLAVTFLHKLHVEIFETNDRILGAKLLGQLPMVGVASISYATMEPSKMLLSLVMIVGTQPLAGKLAVRTGDGILGFTEERRSFDIFVRIFSHKHLVLESEIETDAFTCTCFDFRI